VRAAARVAVAKGVAMAVAVAAPGAVVRCKSRLSLRPRW
jgi:hypothetical protein